MMFGFGSKGELEELRFEDPSDTAQEAFNSLVDIVSGLEHEEHRWEKVIEKAEESGRTDRVKVETLLKKMGRKHGEFEEKLAAFEQKADERRNQASESEAKRLAELESVVERIRDRADSLDAVIETAGEAVERGNLAALDKLEEDIENDRQETLEDLEKLGKKLS